MTTARTALAIALLAGLTACNDTRPTAAQLNAALSNNAAVYFKAGVVAGASVERSRPGLPTQSVIQLARSYYASLGPDPFLGVDDTARATLKADQNLSSMRAAPAGKAVPRTNAAPVTNTVSEVTTNAPAAPTNAPAP